MIIMVNGPFGVGKTSVANELLNRIDNSMLFDPEEVGYMLRNVVTEDVMLPEEQTGDFQDIELWRILTVEVASRLKMKYGKHLIVPMTIHNRDRFRYIYDGFKTIDEKTYHFCLVAEEKTIHERLIKRGEKEGNWCFQQTRKCVEAFKDPLFHIIIDTNERTIEQITALIRENIFSMGGLEID